MKDLVLNAVEEIKKAGGMYPIYEWNDNNSTEKNIINVGLSAALTIIYNEVLLKADENEEKNINSLIEHIEELKKEELVVPHKVSETIRSENLIKDGSTTKPKLSANARKEKLQNEKEQYTLSQLKEEFDAVEPCDQDFFLKFLQRKKFIAKGAKDGKPCYYCMTFASDAGNVFYDANKNVIFTKQGKDKALELYKEECLGNN